MCVAALAVTPAGLLAGGRALLRPAVLGAGLAIGLLSSVIPYSLELEALRRIPAKVFGIWMSLEPARRRAGRAGPAGPGAALESGPRSAAWCWPARARPGPGT